MSEIIDSTYKVIKKIGAGGGGNVFLAYHLRLEKYVVLKADKRKITTRPELLRREVDILKDLSHSYIPQVYDYFVEGETVYTVMDYIEGESLDKPLKRGEKFSQPQIIQWAKQLLEALCYLHSPTHGNPPRGFVHSDIKPANLMVTADNTICLIDFNIALALGEVNVIGCSDGYASPEHYGLDFSSSGSDTTYTNRSGRNSNLNQNADFSQSDPNQLSDRTETVVLSETQTVTYAASEPLSPSKTAASSKKMMIVPDIRSDIYSTGATLYHLLSGQRPMKNAKEVISLSEEMVSPQIIKIISKAMNPNPDLRYQTAEEMLWDFSHLRENDPRTRRLKKHTLIAGILFSVVFASGVLSAMAGLKRMKTTESWLKLAEYAKTALAEGDPTAAIGYALAALPTKTAFLDPAPIPQAQRVLAEALGVYDLSDGYRIQKTLTLPSAPFCLAIAPDGKTASCIYASSIAVFDTATAELLTVLPAADSALAEVTYLDNHTVLYAGKEGLTAYDIDKKTELWSGKPATSLCISADKKSAAAVYKDEPFATIYSTADGEIKSTVDFEQRHQRVTINDSFANPNDNLLALNYDGTQLGVSFSDGSLQIYQLDNPENDLLLFDETSGYTHFEGGFFQQYFAFSATNAEESVFAVIDTEAAEQTGGFASKSAFHVQTDENGIYVQTEDLFVKIHPVTGEQTPLVTMSEIIQSFARSEQHTLVASQDAFWFFDKNATLIARLEKESGGDFVQIANGTALIGNRDMPTIPILQYESYPDMELFSYDPTYPHDEARLSADGQTVMLFSYQQFRLYQINGELIQEVSIPTAEQVYDQQYIREGTDSWLEVIYNDGTTAVYSAKDGSLLSERLEEIPDASLYEEFFTEKLRIESPLHGTPIVYDQKTGKRIRELEKEDYLTYVTQAGDFIVTQYITTDGYFYGQLLNEKCEVLADLPYLCDVVGETLLFDYPTGNMRQSCIYNKNELIALAQKEMGKITQN